MPFPDFMAKVLITGFEPFSKYLVNISQIVIESLPMSLKLSDPWHENRFEPLDDITIDIETKLLTVDQQGSKFVSNQIKKGKEWDAILHLGLCSKCEKIHIETRARNVLTMDIPDNSGRQISHAKLGSNDLSCSNNIIDRLTNLPIIDAKISLPIPIMIKSKYGKLKLTLFYP